VKLKVQGRNEAYEVAPSKIIALGLNYRDHIEESHSVKVKGFTKEIPAEPVLFPKMPSCLIGEGEEIVIPGFLTEYGFDELRTDFEGELAFILRDRCRNVPPEEAYGHILGFTALNDVSQRNIQTSDKSGWFRGKSFDTFGPVGPQIVLMDDIGDPQNLRLQTRLNGKTRQDANTSLMIFSIRETLAFISKNFTLEPGDLISTGTPAGVGPLSHGDVVEVEIEKIGVLRNRVVDEC
jgi:2-keto-4-pentenoate hydratase/2-oxohepta-3-ene-1,7-dioic acid hydratase in catechol pathway